MYNIYKNTKLQLLKEKRRYIEIKVNGNNIQSKKKKTAANKHRLTQEI